LLGSALILMTCCEVNKLGFEEHFRSDISEKLYNFVRDEVLDNHRFVFYQRMGKTDIFNGLCSHCKKSYVIKERFTPKHGGEWKCENCYSPVILHSFGRGRGKLREFAYVIWYEKSVTDPLSITATGYKAQLDFKESMSADIEFIPVTRYLFRYGHGGEMKVREHYTEGFFYQKTTHFLKGWTSRKHPTSICGVYYFSRYHSVQGQKSMEEAVKGTPFEKSGWKDFYSDSLDAIYIFSAIAKYPFIEYLTKTGLGEIARSMVRGESIYRCLNLRGTSMKSIVGLSKQEFGEWKKSCGKLEAKTLRAYKWLRSQGVIVSWKQADRLRNVISEQHYSSKLKTLMSRVSIQQFIRYIDNQLKKDKEFFGCIDDVVTSYSDYFSEALELGMDMESNAVLFPNLLRVAHHKTTSQVKIKQNPEANRKIKALQPILSFYYHADDKFMIRPIESIGELFAEGSTLQHCVGRYGNDYADEKTVLLVVRENSDQEIPFYTAEIRGGKLIQCRGMKNKPMTDAVKKFMNNYTEQLKFQQAKMKKGAVV